MKNSSKQSQTEDKVRRVQELRRSAAAGTQDRGNRRLKTRANQQRQAISEQDANAQS